MCVEVGMTDDKAVSSLVVVGDEEEKAARTTQYVVPCVTFCCQQHTRSWWLALRREMELATSVELLPRRAKGEMKKEREEAPGGCDCTRYGRVDLDEESCTKYLSF